MEAVTVGAGSVPREQTLKRDFGSCLTTIKMLGCWEILHHLRLGENSPLLSTVVEQLLKRLTVVLQKDTLYSHFKKYL